MVSRLRIERAKRKLTLDDIGAPAGKSKAFLSRVERRLRPIAEADAIRVAEQVGAEVSELFDQEDGRWWAKSITCPAGKVAA